MKNIRKFIFVILSMICLFLVAMTFESKRELDAVKKEHDQVVYELTENFNKTNDAYQKAKDHIWMLNIQRGEYMKTIIRMQEERAEQ